MFIHILYKYHPNGGFATFKFWELLVGEESSPSTFHVASRLTSRAEAVQHAAWQHSGALCLQKSHETDREEGQKHRDNPPP